MPKYIATYNINYCIEEEIEATNPEEAGRLAFERRPVVAETNKTKEHRAQVRWIEMEAGNVCGSISAEFLGVCESCGIGILDREVPGQPWNYSYDSRNECIFCFKCSKEK